MDGYIFGVVLAVAAGIINACGVIIQKRAHIAQLEKPESERVVYICNIRWWAGFATYVAGNLLNAAALSMASQSIISPLTRFAIIVS